MTATAPNFQTKISHMHAFNFGTRPNLGKAPIEMMAQIKIVNRPVCPTHFYGNDIYTVSQVTTFKLSVALSNFKRFSKFLHRWKTYEI